MKGRFLILALLAFAAAPLFAGQVVLLMGVSNQGGFVSQVNPGYLVANGASQVQAAEADVNQQFPAGVLNHLHCHVTPAPSPGNYTIVVRVSAADTGVTCVIGASATSCTDDAHSATVADGNSIDYKITPASNPVSTSVSCYVYFARS